MTKTEFIRKLAEKRKSTLVEAEKELDAFFDVPAEGLGEDGTVKLYGLCKFELKTTKERIGRNPKNGKEYMIPSFKKVKFTASDSLMDKIKNGEC